MLRSESPGTKHKKVCCLYREQGLAISKRPKVRKCPGERTPLGCRHARASQTQSLDFVSGALLTGWRTKCLTVADDLTDE